MIVKEASPQSRGSRMNDRIEFHGNMQVPRLAPDAMLITKLQENIIYSVFHSWNSLST